MTQFAALTRQTLKTVSHRYRIRWAAALIIFSIMVPILMKGDPVSTSAILLSIGALYAATIWPVDPRDGTHQLWISAGCAKSTLVMARVAVAFLYSTPWGIVSALIQKMLYYPDSSLLAILFSQFIVLFFLTAVGQALNLAWGQHRGTALILGFLLAAVVVNPLWQQYARWVMPGLSFYYPAVPDPVNMLGLASLAVLTTAAAVFRIGRGEFHDRRTKQLMAAVGVLLLVGSGAVEAWDRHELATRPFVTAGDADLTVQYRGISDQEATAVYHLGQDVEAMLQDEFGLSIPDVDLVVYRSRNLQFEDDPGVPQGDHNYKLRYNGQRSLRLGERYNWPARLTRDLFADAWREFDLDDNARVVVNAWGSTLGYDVVGPAAVGAADLETGIAHGLAKAERFSGDMPDVYTEADAQLFLYGLMDHEGLDVLGRIQQELRNVPGRVTLEAFHQAVLRASRDPAFVDAAWAELLPVDNAATVESAGM